MRPNLLKSTKNLLEEDIKFLVHKFQEETGLTVTNIEVIPPRIVCDKTESKFEIKTICKLQ